MSELLTTLENIKIKVVVEKRLADMEDWKPFEYWKRVTYDTGNSLWLLENIYGLFVPGIKMPTL